MNCKNGFNKQSLMLNVLAYVLMGELWLSFTVERDVNGRLLDEARCETCHGKVPGLSVPNSSGDRY